MRQLCPSPSVVTGSGHSCNSLILGVDIGGTALRAALAQDPTSILAKTRRPSPAHQPPEAMVSAIGEMYRDLISEVGIGEVMAVGISSPGPVDTVAGALVDPPNLPLYTTVPLREMLQRELNLPVALENDANAAALAEHSVGLGQGAGNMVYVTLSTGIGAGIISDGRLVRGARGAAGEVGHIKLMVDGPQCGCGQHGCWEALASGSAIRKEVLRRLREYEKSMLSDIDPSAIDARAVFEAAEAGDSLAASVIERAAHFTGLGLAAVVDVLNPEAVIVGGGLTQMGDRLLGPAFETCRRNIFPLHERCLRLEVSFLGDDVSLVGALVLGRELAGTTGSMQRGGESNEI